MEEQKSFFRTFGVVVFSAIVNAICFIAIVGVPLTQFFSHNRDSENIQPGLPQKEMTAATEPQPALKDIPAPAPAPVPVQEEPKPKAPVHTARVKAVVKAPKKSLEKVSQPESSGSQQQESAKTEAAPAQEKEPKKVVEVDLNIKQQKEQQNEQTATPEQVKREEMQDKQESGKENLVPVKEKIAGVQAAGDDSATEATSQDANPPPPAETQPAAVTDSNEDQK